MGRPTVRMSGAAGEAQSVRALGAPCGGWERIGSQEVSQPSDEQSDMKPRLWTYGVTTVASRLHSLLPQTLESLAVAGFEQPRVFVDGCNGLRDRWTYRGEVLGPFGNWILALAELYIRSPACHYYALFQDDILACRRLREYLSAQKLPECAYWNLYTAGPNEPKTDRIGNGTTTRTGIEGWKEGSKINDRGDQSGIGALGLVFNRQGVQALLTSPTIVVKPSSAIKPRTNLDGAIVTAMNKAGFRELVHVPSLLQHVGQRTTIQGPKRDNVGLSATWKVDQLCS
jgi:hypothetical protein